MSHDHDKFIKEAKEKIAELTEEEERKLSRTKGALYDREEKHLRKKKLDDEAYNKELYRLYSSTSRDIEKEILSSYTRYAGKEGLTPEEAYKKISKFDAARFADEAARLVEEKDFSTEATEKLRAYNLKMRVSRLELMKREIDLRTIALAEEEKRMLETRLNGELKEELERQAGILHIPEDIRKEILVSGGGEIVQNSFSGAPFSYRVFANSEELSSKLKTGLERTLFLGENPKSWAKSLSGILSKEFGLSGGGALYAAEVLAITESARVQEETALSVFGVMGYKKYIWVATPDERTCPICSALDGEVFEVKDGEIGKTTPPVHPCCRCSVAAFV